MATDKINPSKRLKNYWKSEGKETAVPTLKAYARQRNDDLAKSWFKNKKSSR